VCPVEELEEKAGAEGFNEVKDQLYMNVVYSFARIAVDGTLDDKIANPTMAFYYDFRVHELILDV